MNFPPPGGGPAGSSGTPAQPQQQPGSATTMTPQQMIMAMMARQQQQQQQQNARAGVAAGAAAGAAGGNPMMQQMQQMMQNMLAAGAAPGPGAAGAPAISPASATPNANPMVAAFAQMQQAMAAAKAAGTVPAAAAGGSVTVGAGASGAGVNLNPMAGMMQNLNPAQMAAMLQNMQKMMGGGAGGAAPGVAAPAAAAAAAAQLPMMGAAVPNAPMVAVQQPPTRSPQNPFAQAAPGFAGLRVGGSMPIQSQSQQQQLLMQRRAVELQQKERQRLLDQEKRKLLSKIKPCHLHQKPLPKKCKFCKRYEEEMAKANEEVDKLVAGGLTAGTTATGGLTLSLPSSAGAQMGANPLASMLSAAMGNLVVPAGSASSASGQQIVQLQQVVADPAQEYTNSKTFNLSTLLFGQIEKASFFKELVEGLTVANSSVGELAQIPNATKEGKCDTVEKLVDKATRVLEGCDVYLAGSMTETSTFMAFLLRLMLLRPSTEQLKRIVTDASENAYVRLLGFVLIRYCFDADRIFAWYQPFFLDRQELRFCRGEVVTVGEALERLFLFDRYGDGDCVLPRIPTNARRKRALVLLPLEQQRERERSNLRYAKEVDAAAFEARGGKNKHRPVEASSNGDWLRAEIISANEYAKARHDFTHAEPPQASFTRTDHVDFSLGCAPSHLPVGDRLGDPTVGGALSLQDWREQRQLFGPVVHVKFEDGVYEEVPLGRVCLLRPGSEGVPGGPAADDGGVEGAAAADNKNGVAQAQEAEKEKGTKEEGGDGERESGSLLDQGKDAAMLKPEDDDEALYKDAISSAASKKEKDHQNGDHRRENRSRERDRDRSRSRSRDRHRDRDRDRGGREERFYEQQHLRRDHVEASKGKGKKGREKKGGKKDGKKSEKKGALQEKGSYLNRGGLDHFRDDRREHGHSSSHHNHHSYPHRSHHLHRHEDPRTQQLHQEDELYHLTFTKDHEPTAEEIDNYFSQSSQVLAHGKIYSTRPHDFKLATGLAGLGAEERRMHAYGYPPASEVVRVVQKNDNLSRIGLKAEFGGRLEVGGDGGLGEEPMSMENKYLGGNDPRGALGGVLPMANYANTAAHNKDVDGPEVLRLGTTTKK